MKKSLRNSEGLYIHDGGDEGDRTPDLLTASQALSQLSYAPVRKSTIRELGRRCKGNFGKTFAAAAADADAGTGCEAPRCPFRPRGAPRGRAPAAPHAFPAPVRSLPGTSRHETCPSTTSGRHRPTTQSWAKIKPQADGLRFSLNTGYGRGVGVKRSRWAGFVAAIIPGTRPEAFGSGQTGYFQENVARKKETGQTNCLTC